MNRPYEIILTESFRELLPIYVSTFGASAIEFGLDNEHRYLELLGFYENVIENDVEKIFELAVRFVGQYMNQFKIHAVNTIDEYKSIYFLGIAISSILDGYEFHSTAKVNLFSMVKMLDYRLTTLNAFRPQMSVALQDQIRRNKFYDKFGNTGCYLLYKCIGSAVSERDNVLSDITIDNA